VKKNMILRSWIDFNEALHLYVIKHEIDEYNFNCFERLNQSIIKICIKHADKRAKKISFNNVDKLSCTLLLSKDAWVMLTFNMSIKKSLINDLMSIIVDVIWNNDTDDSFTTFSADENEWLCRFYQHAHQWLKCCFYFSQNSYVK